MTVKIRHDRPDQPHDQARGQFFCLTLAGRAVLHSLNSAIVPSIVVSEISKIWRIGMGEDDRIYYNNFATEARKEYERQVIEYRATGSYTPSQKFCRLEGTNFWVKRHIQNGLEKEISQYPTCQFPKRPPTMDEAYERREERSIFRRKLKQKGLLNEDGTLKNGLDFEELLQKEREKNLARSDEVQESSDDEED